MKLSFDYDNTLSDNQAIQLLVRCLVEGAHDVWILTSRAGPPVVNKDLYAMMYALDIPKTNVIFVDNGSKLEAFKKHKFEAHFDDDHLVVDEINKAFPETCPAMLVGFDSTFMYHFVNKTLDQHNFK